LKKELDGAGIQDSLDHIIDEMKLYKYVITVIGNKKTDIIPSLTQSTRLASKIAGIYCLKEKYLSPSSWAIALNVH
jgi:hypothetical protein